jgi:ribosomal protein S27E
VPVLACCPRVFRFMTGIRLLEIETRKEKERGQDMKINCLSCGHKVDLDDVYDDYQGQIRCLTCAAMLEIKTEEGQLRSVIWANVSPSPLEEKPA